MWGLARSVVVGVIGVWGLAHTMTLGAASQPAATTAAAPSHAKTVKRLLIKNAMIIYGNARPAFGPRDILVQDGLIARIGGPDRGAPPEAPPDAVIDATGKYVMPGMINTHIHLQDARNGIPMPIQYELNLYLAAGNTTIRDVGMIEPDDPSRVSGDMTLDQGKDIRARSAAGTMVAPRVVLYAQTRRIEPSRLREHIRRVKADGADGIKILAMDRDQLEATLDETHKLGLPTTAHIGVEETTARDYVELGVNSIEHFYGVADAALDGIQNFPPEMSYSNEIYRFGQAGELYTQPNLNREKLSALLDLMVEKGVAWSPTMSTYEASRDLIRNQYLPWYRDYLHPALEEYFKPSLTRHGSYWIGWTNTQEVRWRKNYQVWMDVLREFGVKGGIITTGDDAGYLYGSLYGFGQIRELELHEEAGFHPLEVLKHATVNGAKVLGLDDRLGKIREGFIADLLVVNGNPLANLHVLNPYGTGVNVNGANVHGGGIEWTIKQGIPYHVPTLMAETKKMVEDARASRATAKR